MCLSSLLCVDTNIITNRQLICQISQPGFDSQIVHEKRQQVGYDTNCGCSSSSNPSQCIQGQECAEQWRKSVSMLCVQRYDRCSDMHTEGRRLVSISFCVQDQSMVVITLMVSAGTKPSCLMTIKRKINNLLMTSLTQSVSTTFQSR